MSLAETTAALRRCNDRLERQRLSTPPPPAPAELTTARVAEIAKLMVTSPMLRSVLHVNGVTIGEVMAFCARATR